MMFFWVPNEKLSIKFRGFLAFIGTSVAGPRPFKVTDTGKKALYRLSTYLCILAWPSIDRFNRLNDSTVYAVRCQWTNGSRSTGAATHQPSNRIPPQACIPVRAYHVYRVCTSLPCEFFISGIYHLLTFSFRGISRWPSDTSSFHPKNNVVLSTCGFSDTKLTMSRLKNHWVIRFW